MDENTRFNTVKLAECTFGNPEVFTIRNSQPSNKKLSINQIK